MYKIPKIYIQAQIWRKPITRLWHDMDASKGLLTVSPFQTFLSAFLERPQDEFLSFVFFPSQATRLWCVPHPEYTRNRALNISTYIRKAVENLEMDNSLGSFHRSKRSDSKRYVVEVRWGILLRIWRIF